MGKLYQICSQIANCNGAQKAFVYDYDDLDMQPEILSLCSGKISNCTMKKGETETWVV